MNDALEPETTEPERLQVANWFEILHHAFDGIFPSEHMLEKILDRWETMP